MAEDGAGCIGAVLAIAAVGWVPLHFSGKSILDWRETKEIREIYDSKSFLVTCRYFNSTGAEESIKQTGYPDNYYCPRLKDLGN